MSESELPASNRALAFWNDFDLIRVTVKVLFNTFILLPTLRGAQAL
jgi:hypothetical protein